MTEWERIELRPLFSKIIDNAKSWKPEVVLSRTQKIGTLVLPQLSDYSDGKFRADRNESVGFFEAIDRFIQTDLPISLDHFTNLVNQYKDRITPYPHYSGIKITLPTDFSEIDDVEPKDIPEIDDEQNDNNDSQLKLM